MSKKICVLGASIVQGHWDLEKGGWVNRFDLCLAKKAQKFGVFNLGISGDTSTKLLSRMENELAVRRTATIIVSVGTNDAGIENGEHRTDLKTFRENLERILDISRKFTSEVVFLGALSVNEKFSTPVSWRNNLYYYNRELKEYDLVVKEFCQEKNVVFLPMQEVLNDNDLPDGVHPNAAGHEKIFQRVKACLEENKII
jgi:lysophospholipase L1-like esterase